MKKEIRDRLTNKMHSTDDKEAVKEFVERKRVENDQESKRLEAATKKAIDDLKNTISRAGRNIKVNVTEDLPEGITEEEYRILEEYTEAAESDDANKRAIYYLCL